MIGWTVFTGETIMCCLIIEGKRSNHSINTGMDIFVEPVGSLKELGMKVYILQNSGPEKYFPGGLTCHFRGKDEPCFMRWHESGSITSILVDMLKALDVLDLFPRKDPLTKPFILLDGHSSRLLLNFLKYINDPKDHRDACIGVPYGTALW